MSFEEILNNTSSENKQALMQQALKRQEYNRKYQAKLREATKLMTLQHKIDANLQHVLGYIKANYASEYEAYVEPVKEAKVVVPGGFQNWLLLSQPTYRSVRYAYEICGIEGMSYEEFKAYFKLSYVKNDSGEWVKL